MQFEKRLYTVDHVLHSVQNVQLYYRSIYLRTNKELMTFCSKKKLENKGKQILIILRQLHDSYPLSMFLKKIGKTFF